MSTTKHTAEPWVVRSGTSIKANVGGGIGDFVATTSSGIAHDQYSPEEKQEAANAARIVTCVNACAGMEDPARAIQQTREALEAIRLSASGIGAAFRNERREIDALAFGALRALGG